MAEAFIGVDLDAPNKQGRSAAVVLDGRKLSEERREFRALYFGYLCTCADWLTDQLEHMAKHPDYRPYVDLSDKWLESFRFYLRPIVNRSAMLEDWRMDGETFSEDLWRAVAWLWNLAVLLPRDVWRNQHLLDEKSLDWRRASEYLRQSAEAMHH